MIGSTISHYRVVEEIGRGGMGVVYKAVDTKLDRTVALKFLPPGLSADSEAKQRFIQEAKSASSLDHQNICTIHEIGEASDGKVFIAMACYEGRTIRKEIADSSLTVEQAIDYTTQIADGLAEAHAAGIVHRDIKPGNLMVTERDVVKILDFGLAKVTDVSLTTEGKRYGTIVYMSPEQARGERVTHSTDIWSLGAVLYEMLTGVRPFDAPYESAIFYAIINVEPVPPREHNPNIPKALEELVLRCLAKDPAERYQNASELASDLKRLKRGSSTIAALRYESFVSRRHAVNRNVILVLPVLVVIVLIFAVPSFRNIFFPGKVPLPELNGVAVLPVMSVGTDSVDQALLDGLGYLIGDRIQALERSHESLWGRAYRDAFRFNVDTPESAANNLNVDLVIAERVRSENDELRIEFDLIDPRSDMILRSANINELWSDVSKIESSIVQALVEMMELDIGIQAIDELIYGGTNNPVAFRLLLEGQGALQRNRTIENIDKAVVSLEGAVEADLSFYRALDDLGFAYWRKFESTRDDHWAMKAIESTEAVLRLDSSMVMANNRLGYYYSWVGRSDEAEKVIRRTLRLDPVNRSAIYQLATILERQNRLTEAETVYLDAIEAKPNYWEFYFDLGEFYNKASRHQEAVGQYRQVIRLAPAYAWGFNNLAVQYHILNQLSAADSMYQKAATVNMSAVSARSYAFHNLGVLRTDRDDFLDAVGMFEKSLELDDDFHVGWSELGNAKHWLGREEEAQLAWEKVIEITTNELDLDPLSNSAHRFRITSLAKLGRFQETREAIRQVLQLQRITPVTLEGIGKAYEIMGDRKQALSFIHQALDAGYSSESVNSSRWFDGLREDRGYQCRFTGDPC